MTPSGAVHHVLERYTTGFGIQGQYPVIKLCLPIGGRGAVARPNQFSRGAVTEQPSARRRPQHTNTDTRPAAVPSL